MKKFFILTFLIFFSNGLAQNSTSENQKLQPFGLQDKVITSLTAEQSDYNSKIQISDYIFTGTENGVFKTSAISDSSDWVSIGLENKSVTALTVQHWGVGPVDGLTLFAAVAPDYEHGDSTLIFRREVYLPTDTNWVASDSGIDTSISEIYALNSYCFSGHEPPQPMLAGGNNGLFQASRIDYFWTQSEIEDVNLQPLIKAIDVNPHWNGDFAWAAGYMGLSSAAFRSIDQGKTWKVFPLSDIQEYVPASSVAINKRNPDSVYVCNGNYLLLTPDNGEHWEVILSTRGGNISQVAVDPMHPENVFVGTWFVDDSHQSPDHAEFLHSTNGGKDWDQVDQATNVLLKAITSISVVNKFDDNNTYVFVGTAGTGVWRYKYKTLNNDASSYFPLTLNDEWTYNSNIFLNPQTEKITDTVRINNKFYYGFSVNDFDPYEFFRQSDNRIFILNTKDSTESMLYDFNAETGESWELPEEFYCSYGKEITLVSKSDTVETPAGTFYNCYHFMHSPYCVDAGITDTWLAEGIGKVRYKAIFLAGEGDFVLTDYITLVEKNSEQFENFSFRLFQNYPNPFNPTTSIEYRVGSSEYVTLKVYDVLGREVATLVNEEKLPGNYEVEFNPLSGIWNLASGIYFYRLQANGYSSTKKMILLK